MKAIHLYLFFYMTGKPHIEATEHLQILNSLNYREEESKFNEIFLFLRKIEYTMIQRIQSIYLLLSALLTSTVLFIKLADFTNATSKFILEDTGIYQVMENTEKQLILGTYPIILLAILTTFLSLVILFFFKRRILQIRLSGINIAFQLGLTGMILYLGQSGAKNLDAVVSYHYVIVFPLIAMVLTILAIISIGKDEALIRSLNRIR